MSKPDGWVSVDVPPLSMVFVGRPSTIPGVECDPVAYTFDGCVGGLDSFDLVERAVLRALCADLVKRIDAKDAA